MDKTIVQQLKEEAYRSSMVGPRTPPDEAMARYLLDTPAVIAGLSDRIDLLEARLKSAETCISLLISCVLAAQPDPKFRPLEVLRVHWKGMVDAEAEAGTIKTKVIRAGTITADTLIVGVEEPQAQRGDAARAAEASDAHPSPTHLRGG